MDRNNLNVVVFDEQESFTATEQSRFSYGRRHNPYDTYSSSQSPDLVLNELNMLSQHVHNLQEKTNKIE